MKIGIIGGLGWIGSALGRALIETGRVAPADLVILKRGGGAGDYFGHAVSWAKDVADLVARADLIVVSVRPQDWPGLALDARGKLVVSFMAGVALADLPPRTIRAMPNAAAEIRAGYTPWVAGPGVTEADRATVRNILAAIGREDALEAEAHLDLMTALSGAGPAYPALMARVMLDFLRAEGVAGLIAERAVEAVICDAAGLLRGRMDQAGALVQSFVDYAGTTAAGLQTAKEHGFSAAITAALAAATARAREMAAAQRAVR